MVIVPLSPLFLNSMFFCASLIMSSLRYQQWWLRGYSKGAMDTMCFKGVRLTRHKDVHVKWDKGAALRERATGERAALAHLWFVEAPRTNLCVGTAASASTSCSFLFCSRPLLWMTHIFYFILGLKEKKVSTFKRKRETRRNTWAFKVNQQDVVIPLILRTRLRFLRLKYASSAY